MNEKGENNWRATDSGGEKLAILLSEVKLQLLLHCYSMSTLSLPTFLLVCCYEVIKQQPPSFLIVVFIPQGEWKQEDNMTGYEGEEMGYPQSVQSKSLPEGQ